MFFFIAALSSEIYASEGTDSIRIYGGNYSQTTFLDILLRQEVKYNNSTLLVGSYSRSLDTNLRDIYFQTEGQIGKHFGLQNHWEMNGALFARWKLPIRWMDLSLAVGEGISAATANPPLENQKADLLKLRTRSETSRPVLNYIAVDLEVGLPKSSTVSALFFRIHHRSGVFGTYCPAICGSNFVSYGIRMDL